MAAVNDTAAAPAAAPAKRPSLIERVAGWTSERANPIVVRYARQQLRSRGFIILFSTVLGFATLFSITVGATAGEQGEGEAAFTLFGLLAAIWAFAVWVFEPIAAFRATANERDEKTWDLVRLTGLSPGKLIRGMFLASVLQGLLYSAAIAPFLVMAYLLRGIALEEILFVLFLIPVAGWCASAGAIFLGSVSGSKGARNALGVLVAIVSGFIWFSTLTVWLNFDFTGHFVIGGLMEGPGYVFLADFAVIWIGAMLVLGATILRHPASNRSTAPRVYAWVVFLNGVVWSLFASEPFLSEALVVASFFGALAAFLLGIFAITEDYVITPRQYRETRDMRWWQLPILFAPGAARGRLAYLSLVAAIAATVTVAYFLGPNGSRLREPMVFTILICAHGTLLITLCDAAARRWFARRLGNPVMRRVLFISVFASLAFIGSVITSLAGDRDPIAALTPIPGMWIIADRPGRFDDELLFIILAGGAAAFVLLIQAVRRTKVLERTVAELDA
ncbi:MAG: hypothetical protein EP329_06920 [Deltaproteobacteria bacterium]|nr:MAG: hypothetical protein EP329_06920 [Deltaproteobacteria bacterium]